MTRLTPGRTLCWRIPTLMFGGTCGLTRSVESPSVSEVVSLAASSGAASEEAERSVAAGAPLEEESGSSADRASAWEELAERPSAGLCK